MKKIYSAILVSLLIIFSAFGVSACSKNFSITVTGGTASATKSSAGTTITLNANEAPIGKAFHHWESAELIIEGDTFVMPAKKRYGNCNL